MDSINWQELFSFSISPGEIVLRGSFMYWLLFLLFRFVARRDMGSLGIADLLIIVIVADAAQNGMAGDGESLADAALLVATLIMWNRIFDAAAFYWPAFNRFMNPAKVALVSHGRKLPNNMRRAAITDEELDAKLRENGANSIQEVEHVFLESDGQLSVVKKKR